jgi:hypothetical protein
VEAILSAARAGECVALVGLSGAGKSNLMGFLYHRCGGLEDLSLALVDANRARPPTAAGLFGLAHQSLGGGEPAAGEPAALEAAVGQALERTGGGLCLLFDRFDTLSEAERALAAGPLRALRDAYKYRLTFVTATRRPPDPRDELAELFYAHTLWLGPLSRENALWSAAQYGARRGLGWDAAQLDRLVSLSWGYPALLRACCEACAAGAPPELEALREHPAVQRRVQEFWADQPTPEDLRRAGLAGQPLLSAAAAPVPSSSPDLTGSEHRLLAFFQAHPSEVCAKDDLIRAVWPDERVADGLRDDSLAQLIRRLRQKIEIDPGSPRRILTIPGRGYRYVP